jgi:hypothetical protein
MKDNQKLCLVRIHNNEPIQPSRDSADLIAGLCLDQRIIFDQFEVFKQPEFLSLRDYKAPRSSLFKRRNFHRKVELSWAGYLGDKNLFISWFLSLAGQTRYAIKLFACKSFLIDEILKMQIERFLTLKHVTAIEVAIESDAEAIIILESDATLNQNSTEGLLVVIETLVSGMNKSMYINVAGGLKKEIIGIDRLVIPKQETEKLLELRLPVTNTNCAYGFTKHFGLDFISHVNSNKANLELGADWLINHFLMNSDLGVLCFHSDPPALDHGSFIGSTQSWSKRDRV